MRAGLTAGHSITITVGDLPICTYAYGAALPRLARLRTLTGAPLASTLTWTPPHADPGRADHLTLTELSATASTATVAHHLRWSAVDEWRSLTAALAGTDTWLLLFENTLTNVSGRPLPLTGPSLSLTGTTTTSSAARTDWRAAYDPEFTLVVVDDTANLRHPPRWPSGLSPAPFSTGAVTLEADRTVAFRYAVVVAPGDHDPGRASALAALGRDALAGPLPTVTRGHVCRNEHPRRGPIHRTRTRVLLRQCENHDGTPPTA
ncbi:DUF6807 family protein [Actinoplanes regularis]|uniref:DUF6807 family protein n=1 Tax=Actinoplanes regularis TaxID=52697 RepID=UPI002555E41F|nr:DUF6807 family protein [Actinoplanes regularis]GLW27712.1 hypothetical protein Areg01_06520 [Actinoplanes regularis]